jgi:hypothetical protein
MKKILLSAAFISLFYTVSGIAQSFTSSNLPIVVINSYSQNIDNAWSEIIVGMGIIDNGPNRNYLTDPFNGYNGKVDLEIHGSSTVMFPKKSFNIETVNSSNVHQDVSLFGLPADHDWVFKALYQDKTFLRDELAFKMFTTMGHYSSRTLFFELVVDGDYRGVYQLEEKVKRNTNRLDISNLRTNDVSGDQLTGGFIIKLDKYQPSDPGWNSAYNSNATNDSANYFLYYYPKPDSMPSVQKSYIKNYFDKFEGVLASSYWNSPDSGYTTWINMTSFIDNFLVNEISRNVDGYRCSTYFYKDRDSKSDGKLHCGPVWDFNIAFDNCYYNGGSNPSGWQYQQFAYTNFVPFWWRQMMSDITFRNELKCRYQYLRGNALSLNSLYAHIDSMAAWLNESQVRNFQRWPIMGQNVWPNPSPVPTSYAGEISNLKNWLQQRLAWLDINMPGVCTSAMPEYASIDDAMSCFPNPFSDNFNVNYYVPENAYVKLELLNLVGEQVEVLFRGNKMAGNYSHSITETQLVPGIYFIKLTIGDNSYVKKLVKS